MFGVTSTACSQVSTSLAISTNGVTAAAATAVTITNSITASTTSTTIITILVLVLVLLLLLLLLLNRKGVSLFARTLTQNIYKRSKERTDVTRLRPVSYRDALLQRNHRVPGQSRSRVAKSYDNVNNIYNTHNSYFIYLRYRNKHK